MLTLNFKASISVFLAKTVSFFGGGLGVANAKVMGAWVEPASDAADTTVARLGDHSYDSALSSWTMKELAMRHDVRLWACATLAIRNCLC